ncbi:MAG: deoxyribodipyrimidine photo-lyase [Candidatus Berkiella sp.]
MKALNPSIVWFRQDLRIHDNPALFEAAKSKAPLIFVYILDDETTWPQGAASRWWLHYSLQALMQQLTKKYQATLVLQQGKALAVLSKLVHDHQVERIYWNRCYEPDYIARDTKIKKHLTDMGIEVLSFNGALLKEPWEITNKSKQPFRVFTPFWKTLQQETIREIFPSPSKITLFKQLQGLSLAKLALLPTIPWDSGLKAHWEPGEAAAKAKLKKFLQSAIKGYKTQRDFPNIAATSKLSPHLHFGELSPVQIWQAAITLKDTAALHTDLHHFLSELAWREFSYHLLYHFPQLPDKAYKGYFDGFEWHPDNKLLVAWQKGLTGYPIVDAGMRELWHTGWMHNRVRMIVASFLIKHLLQPWQSGEAWFWDTLVDADLANNAASWQWVAGSGADAAPYFRIFNPVLQGEKFDKDGDYVKKWVPELAALEGKFIHQPWEASEEVLKEAGICLGKTYPKPIVEHDFARKRALSAYQKLNKT